LATVVVVARGVHSGLDGVGSVLGPGTATFGSATVVVTVAGEAVVVSPEYLMIATARTPPSTHTAAAAT
jgi:hypothetical protein